MYEAPKLIEVGKTRDVVLGIVPSGGDIDLNVVSPPFPFGEEVPEDTDL